MSRHRTGNDFIIVITLTCGSDVRRFCRVRADETDNVYVFQPRKGGSVKVSYHASGKRHLQAGRGQREYGMQFDAPAEIRSNEEVWEHSFENFSDLMPYKGEDADEIYDIALPPLEAQHVTYAEVSIGRSFDASDWSFDGVSCTTLDQRVFKVPVSRSGILICIRVRRLVACNTNDDIPPNLEA